MITYDPGKWGVWFGLTLYGSVFPKSFCVAAPCALLCFMFGLSKQLIKIDITETSGAGENVGTNFLGGFTFILGFLIVFRSQQAYARWWEGGTLLQELRGEWFNAFSSLLAFCNSSPDQKEKTFKLQHHLVRLFSLLYASALEQVTTIPNVALEIIDLEGFTPESMVFLTRSHDRCEVVLQWLQKLIVDANAADTIKIAPPILSRVYNQLGNGIVNLNNARKITEFPIPFPLAQMVAFMLVCHWLLTLFICAAFIDNMILGTLVCFIVVFSFWSINYISLELEMPFGDDLNDLPLIDMQKDFNQSLICLLQPLSLVPPVFSLDDFSGELRTSKVDFNSYVNQLCEIHQVDSGLRAPGPESPTSPRGSTRWKQPRGSSRGKRGSTASKGNKTRCSFGQPVPSMLDTKANSKDLVSKQSQSATFATADLSTLKRIDGGGLSRQISPHCTNLEDAQICTTGECGKSSVVRTLAGSDGKSSLASFASVMVGSANTAIDATDVEVKFAPYRAEMKDGEPSLRIEELSGSRKSNTGGELGKLDALGDDDNMRQWGVRMEKHLLQVIQDLQNIRECDPVRPGPPTGLLPAATPDRVTIESGGIHSPPPLGCCFAAR